MDGFVIVRFIDDRDETIISKCFFVRVMQDFKGEGCAHTNTYKTHIQQQSDEGGRKQICYHT